MNTQTDYRTLSLIELVASDFSKVTTAYTRSEVIETLKDYELALAEFENAQTLMGEQLMTDEGYREDIISRCIDPRNMAIRVLALDMNGYTISKKAVFMRKNHSSEQYPVKTWKAGIAKMRRQTKQILAAIEAAKEADTLIEMGAIQASKILQAYYAGQNK